MYRNVNSLIGNRMEGTDGDMGKVEELYFDDQAWIIVYLVVKTGNWLFSRKVLISPYTWVKDMDRPGTFPVNLSKEQIKNSPDIDMDLPISRQQEMALHRYYSWQNYWETRFYEGGIWGIMPSPGGVRAQEKTAVGDPHLRSTHAISGYQIETTDGELGHLRDFIISDETWHIEFLVIEMHSWLTGRKVLIARQHIKEIQWATSKVLVDVTKYALENSPLYDESALWDAEAPDAVFDHNLHLR